MKIKKDELPALLFWKYGKFTGEGKRAQEYIKKIKEVELELSTNNGNSIVKTLKLIKGGKND